MRWRSALTGRSIVETGIGGSSQDEGNSMLERQPRSVQDVMENAPILTIETNDLSKARRAGAVLLEYRGPGARPLAGFGAAPQPYFASAVDRSGAGYDSFPAPIPRSGFVHGRIADSLPTFSPCRLPSQAAQSSLR